MAGRGSFQAVKPSDVDRLLALSFPERWDFAATEQSALFVCRMDKAWVAIHCALSDGTMYGDLGEPPLADAVLGDHLVCQTRVGDFVYLKYPLEVTDIAQELAKLSQKRFLDMLAVVEEDEDVEVLGLSFVASESEYVWAYFETMRAFYQRAASEGLAVLFDWG
jgi:hypothetical protein